MQQGTHASPSTTDTGADPYGCKVCRGMQEAMRYHHTTAPSFCLLSAVFIAHLLSTGYSLLQGVTPAGCNSSWCCFFQSIINSIFHYHCNKSSQNCTDQGSCHLQRGSVTMYSSVPVPPLCDHNNYSLCLMCLHNWYLNAECCKRASVCAVLLQHAEIA